MTRTIDELVPYFVAGGITLYRGDSSEIMRSIDMVTVSCMVTDPPYGMAYKSGWLDREIEGDDDTSTRDRVLYIWGGRPALVFGRWSCPRPAATKMLLTWDKCDWPGMGDLSLPWGPSTEEIYVLGSGFVGKRGGSVVRVDRITGSTNHPNEKPVGLMRTLLERCPPGTILDPFAGSGSTLVAAQQMGRRAIGIELDEKYCRTIVGRLSQQSMVLA